MPDTDTNIVIAPALKIPADLIKSLEVLSARLEAARPLPSAALVNLAEQYRLESTYNSNAIEGNTLTLPETRLVLERGLTVAGKPLAHHIETSNGADAWDSMLRLASRSIPIRELMNHSTLQELHEIVMRGLSHDAGRYRTINVRIAGSPHSPPDWSRVLARTEEVLDDAQRGLERWEAGNSLLELLSSVTRSHHGLEAVHPFSDGNGRVGRLVLNLLLIRAGLPPVILPVTRRKVYYRSLAQADGGNLQTLGHFIARALMGSLVRHLGALGGEEALMPLKDLVMAANDLLGDSPYSADYLSLRARQGKLAAAKLDGVWCSSIIALREYLRSHSQMGKRP